MKAPAPKELAGVIVQGDGRRYGHVQVEVADLPPEFAYLRHHNLSNLELAGVPFDRRVPGTKVTLRYISSRSAGLWYAEVADDRGRDADREMLGDDAAFFEDGEIGNK